ncbi:MAG: hypothetical protein SRB2_02927 [Desulfobacteraceae bacterium Eth-SRB2]|nr:MAG: hypothetical protein SRB2_02927 [Desulfobacteraceae bacterium Eth-SRB2]
MQPRNCQGLQGYYKDILVHRLFRGVFSPLFEGACCKTLSSTVSGDNRYLAAITATVVDPIVANKVVGKIAAGSDEPAAAAGDISGGQEGHWRC